MLRHLLILATGFRVAGVLLAVMSIAALVDFADTARVMRQLPPPDTGAPLDIGTYGLIALIANTARGGGYLLHALAGVVTILLVVLSVAAVMLLLFGVLLYLTGRGIGHHALWARIVGFLISAVFLLSSCAIMAVMRRDNAAFALLPIGLSLYSLWVLIWRFV